jgi:hypothetical protein
LERDLFSSNVDLSVLNRLGAKHSPIESAYNILSTYGLKPEAADDPWPPKAKSVLLVKDAALLFLVS